MCASEKGIKFAMVYQIQEHRSRISLIHFTFDCLGCVCRGQVGRSSSNVGVIARCSVFLLFYFFLFFFRTPTMAEKGGYIIEQITTKFMRVWTLGSYQLVPQLMFSALFALLAFNLYYSSILTPGVQTKTILGLACKFEISKNKTNLMWAA